MIYRIGTMSEVYSLQGKLPEDVFQSLAEDVRLMDIEYGAGRNYSLIGGYAILAETKQDILEIRKELDYESHPCESVNYINKNYISVLYVLNNDFSINLYLPISIAPKAILDELDEN